MKALVLGCGSIGLRHVGHLRQLGLSDVEAADPAKEAREKVASQFGISAWSSAEDGLQRRPDVVLICTPASTHIPLAIQALEAGAHVFVEKPLSTTLQGIEALRAKVRSDSRILQVGYNLRYHPAMKAAKEIVSSGRLGKVLTAHGEFGLYLPSWWANRDYRHSYMATESLGGGLLLDVSHEIDLMVWFLGSVREVCAFGGKLSRLEMEGYDAIKLLLRMKSGALASIHIDCLQPTYAREYQLIGEGTALRWSCPQGRADSSLGELLLFERGSGQFQSVPLDGAPQETYLGELRDFLSAVERGEPSPVPVESGIEVLRVALAAAESMKTGSSLQVP